MNLTAVERMLQVCFWADVAPEIQGHRGIGKTDVLRPGYVQTQRTDSRGRAVVIHEYIYPKLNLTQPVRTVGSGVLFQPL